MSKTLIVIAGATGSGKTDLSINIALHYRAPIISTDSRQFYRGIPIGTAQPDAEQLQAVEHHFIASHDLTQDFNCGAYEQEALLRIEELFQEHDWGTIVEGNIYREISFSWSRSSCYDYQCFTHHNLM